MRILLTCISIGLLMNLSAQRESLTDEFAYLSPKERVRIAKKERIESAQDTLFQRLMQEGEEQFRSRDYENALKSFSEARKKRPFNVLAKVKIEDLEALLTGKKTSAEPIEPEHEDNPASLPVIEKNSIESPSSEEDLAPLKRSSLSLKTIGSNGIAKVRANEEKTPKHLDSNESNVEQRIFIEGQKRILERTIEIEGKVMVYRKVKYNWGAIYYFKGDKSITKREWDDMFNPLGSF